MGFGPWEVVIVLLILVIIFGAGRLTQVGNAMGKSVREFRGAVEQPAAPPPRPTIPPVTCPSCQATNYGGNRFCSTCGATLAAPAVAPLVAEVPVETETGYAAPSVSTLVAPEPGTTPTLPNTVPANTCPSCATINPPGQPFCGQCGTRLTPAAA